MRHVTTTATGLMALVMMLVLGVFSAGSASAHLFLYTGPLPVLLLLLSDNAQIFNPAEGNEGTSISCPHFRGHILFAGGTMWGLTAKVTGEYPGKCKGFIGAKATVSPVEYEINADGTISVLKTITITIGSPWICSLLVDPVAANQNLSGLLFLKDPLAPSLALLVHAAVGGIHSLGTNGECAEAGEHPAGTYFGLILVWAHGGTVSWE